MTRRGGIQLATLAARSLTIHWPFLRRLLAIALLALAGGLIVAFDFARGDNAGADAIAYWQAVHTWLTGGNPYLTIIDPTQASGHILPYAYPPWTLLVFLPWALVPWPIAWFAWRWLGVLLFGWTVRWAYARRPLGTAVLIAILGPAIAANFDTGNATIFIVVAIWAGQFVGPRLAGVMWALTTALKVLPVVLLPVLTPQARRVGIVVLSAFALLTLATWPQTLAQMDVALYYPRPFRLDYFILAWAAVPWLWKQPWPPWWLQSGEIMRHWRDRPTLRSAVPRFFGLTSP